MADSLPLDYPGPDVNAAPELLAITGALYVVALVVYGGRICTRLQHRRLGADDFAISLALLLAITEWALFLSSAQHGAGRHNYYIVASEQITTQHLLFTSTLLWAPCMMFIKISIACMLLRMKQTRAWQIFLWVMIAIQIASCVASVIFQLIQCVPLAAIWNPMGHPDATCVKLSSAFISIYVNSGIVLPTDLVFAMIPMTFIRKMQRPLREKIVLTMLMGLGIFATAASVVKTTLVPHYGITGDSIYDAVDLTLWSMLELHSSSSSSSSSSNHNKNTYEDFGTTDSHHQLTKLRPAAMRKKKKMGIGTDVSSLAKKAADRSDESIRSLAENDKLFSLQLAGGGIVKTTELHLESEMLSPVYSMDDGEWKKDSSNSQAKAGWNAV
ncbi:hypothetical protein K504DRAFT_473966 [Pleomassaria siparia CBS 279.74]|uniref:Rhodopsin domain-containing protein n=1 Tax=Pleomassaria siparia CBS 279.74 TaxID=1314801 RepID=A0A6G1JSC2_9PLEO|nr:hypothetical protein K504DRAFT_473966 [Pleomassaria siparia CBS 279.74]